MRAGWAGRRAWGICWTYCDLYWLGLKLVCWLAWALQSVVGERGGSWTPCCRAFGSSHALGTSVPSTGFALVAIKNVTQPSKSLISSGAFWAKLGHPRPSAPLPYRHALRDSGPQKKLLHHFCLAKGFDLFSGVGEQEAFFFKGNPSFQFNPVFLGMHGS